MNAESQGNSWGRQARQRPKCLILMLWTQQGHGSRIQASIMPAGGAGVSDIGLVNRRWIGLWTLSGFQGAVGSFHLEWCS